MGRLLRRVLLMAIWVSTVYANDRTISSCDIRGDWTGGRVDTEIVQEGSGSLRWAHEETDQVSLSAKRLDLSTHKSMRFHIHNNRATGGGVMLILRSESDETEGMDYYSFGVRLNFTGWQSFLVPRSRFDTSRQPRGWDQIDRFYFIASGWGNTPNPEVVLHVDGVVMTDEVPRGPVMQMAEFFSLFRDDVPELSEFHKAVAEKDFGKAQILLANYYRRRTSVPWTFDPPEVDRSISFSRRRADDAVKARVSVIGIPYTFPDSTVDWQYNLTFDRADLANNREWGVQLNRMSFWRDLGRAYWATGDEIYAQAFVVQLRDWIEQCPRPSSGRTGFAPAWRTIEAGIRLTSVWMECWHRFLHSPSLSDEDLMMFLMSIAEQAQHLRENPSSGNWLAHEMGGLYTAGGLFPELVEAADWRKFAIDKMHDALTDQFLPDGAQIELTPGYHRITCSYILGIYERAQLFGRTDELPAGFVQGLENAYVYLVGLMTPDRSIPRFNDSWDDDMVRRFRDVFPVFPHRKEFEWVATGGERGEKPIFTSVLFPYAGYGIMRTGWNRDATYVAFDGGMPGYGHIHFDKLNLVLWSYGRELLYDGGGGQYESSKWRRYGTSTFAHNTVIVDGLPQRANESNRRDLVPSKPVPLVWETTEDYDYVVAAYEGDYGRDGNRITKHERQVLFVKPDFVLVADRLTGLDGEPHNYEARWHVNSTQTDRVNNLIVTTDVDQPNLVIVPLLKANVQAISAQEEPDIRGWWVKRSGPVPTTTVSHTVSGTADQRMLTLLIPLKPGHTHGIQSVNAIGESISEVLFANGQKLIAKIAEGPNPGLDATFISQDGTTIWHITAPSAPHGQ